MLKKIQTYIANYAACRTAPVLYSLSDKQLNDIGLTRENLIEELKERFSQ